MVGAQTSVTVMRRTGRRDQMCVAANHCTENIPPVPLEGIHALGKQ